MKTRSLALTLVLALAVTVVAQAATNKLTGKVVVGLKTDPNATVTLKVKTNRKGTATKVKSIAFKNVTAACSDTADNPSVQEMNLTVKNIKIEKFTVQGRTSYTFQKRKQSGDQPYAVSGTFKNRKGTRVTNGNLDIATFGAVICRVQSATFKAKRK